MKKKLFDGTPDLFSQAQRIKLRADFYAALSSLTDQQKRAVETIEGPVMVLAGPGTGKTQVLAARYGYILDKTDTAIHQVLCLTYSEAGVQAMRERLFQFIGPAAHEAHIFTYHAFCNKIINENPEYFFDFKKFRLASTIQRFELIEKILLELPDDHVLQRVIGDRHFDILRLARQYENIKKEQRDIPLLVNQIREHISTMALDEDYRYKMNQPRSGAKKGDLKPDYFTNKAKFERAIDALETYFTYLRKMQEHQWLDFNDMLLEVQSAFAKHPALLAKYQENYLYILVDEFQDTNVIQNNIVLALCDYWEQPNLFVVGDDDQAIYRFQGADQQNLLTLIEKYPGIEIICITENFRTTQALLNAADVIISVLATRIQSFELFIPKVTLDKIDKKLIAAGVTAVNHPPVLKCYINPQQETLALYDYIRKLWIETPQALKYHAVIYRRHKTVQDLVYLLELSGIPMNFRSSKNLLEEPLIVHFILLLNYLQAEYKEKNSGEPFLIQLLYLPYWKLDARDISALAFLERKTRVNKNLREKILNPESWPESNFFNRDSLIDFINKTQQWITSLPPVQTLSILVEDILRHSGILAWALNSKECNWHLRALNSLFAFIKSEAFEDPGLNLEKFLQRVAKMESFDLDIPIESQYGSSQGVNLMTAHGSKGSEFESVWIMNAVAQDWEDSFIQAEQPYKIPDNLRQIEQSKRYQKDDERRLFYVSMTRAKKDLFISWSTIASEQRAWKESLFVSELKAYLNVYPPLQEVEESLLKEKMELILHKKTTPPELINHDLIDQFAEDFVMNCTELDKYLECPRKFYFEEVLRIPRAPNAHLGLGIAVHEALHDFFHISLTNPDFQVEYLVDFFCTHMKKNEWYFTPEEFEGLIRKFTHQLPLFFKQHHFIWKDTVHHKLEYYIDRINFEGVPINGKIDQVIHKDGQTFIVDFKSGRGDSTSSATKLKSPFKGSTGGNYWRQAMFYKLLLDRDPQQNWNTSLANIIFLQANKLESGLFLNKEYSFQEAELGIISKQILDTYQKIKNHEFDYGCEKPECEWCTFIRHRGIIIQRETSD